MGSVITIAGATFRPERNLARASVADSTHFTFITSGISDQTATSTITAVRAWLGFLESVQRDKQSGVPG